MLSDWNNTVAAVGILEARVQFRRALDAVAAIAG
jgi:hypothetical protein